MSPKGIMVALYTPFMDDQSAIDVAALDQHIQHLIKSGVHGLVPGGSTGDFTTLTLEERKQLVEVCVKSAAGRVPAIAGIGALSTKDGVNIAKHAAGAGAVALMVVPPFYNAPSFEELYRLLAELHSVSQLPIMYYNIPSASLKLSPAQLAGLSEVGVEYMKDTSGDAPALTELLFSLQDKITAFNGWHTLTFYGLAAGAKGSVWGATNIIPEPSIELWDALAVRKDLNKGRELWAEFIPSASS